MTHLTADELVDALEGGLAADRRTHLAGCDECRRQLNDLADVLTGAKQVAVPEPSPWFWNQLSARVNETIDADAAGAWPQWLRWQVLVPLGAAAMIVLSLMMALPKQSRIGQVADVTESVEVELVEADNWGALAEIVGELDIETASAAGVIEPGRAEQAVLDLTAEERQELSRLLQAELTRAKS